MANYRYIHDKRTGVTHRILGVVDNTLTEEGIAADAKAVGNEIVELKNAFGGFSNTAGIATIGGGSASDGSLSISANENIITLTGSNGASSFFELDRELVKLSGMTSAHNNTKLKANHTYRFTVEKISGSFVGNDNYVTFVIADGASSSLYDLSGNGGSVEFSFNADKSVSIINYVRYGTSVSSLVVRISLIDITMMITAEQDTDNKLVSLSNVIGVTPLGQGSVNNSSLIVSIDGYNVSVDGSYGASSYFEIDKVLEKITNAAGATCRTKAKANHTYRLSVEKISGSFDNGDNAVLFIIGDGGDEWLYQISANGGNVDFSFASDKDIAILCYVKWDTTVSSLVTRVSLTDITNYYTIFEKYAEQISNAECGADYYRGGGMLSATKNFSIMMVSDSHFDYDAVKNSVLLCDRINSVDALIHLGDTSSITSIPKSGINPFTSNVVNEISTSKPFFVCLGNHDGQQLGDSSIYGTVEQGVAAIMPNLNTANIYDERGYGYYDFDDYNIRLIILNCFDYPSTTTNGQYDYYGSSILWQQEQLDFLVDTLKSVPENYTVIIASHYAELSNIDNTKIDQHPSAVGIVSMDNEKINPDTFMSDVVVSDIISAYKNKTTISKSYTYSNGNDTQTVNVNDTFVSSYGDFAIWICGHRHKSCIAQSSVGSYLVYVNDTSGCGTAESSWITAYSNQPRCEGTNTRDLITVMSIDTANKVIKLTRIGAHINRFLDDENLILLSYNDD